MDFRHIELMRYARTPIALNVKAGDQVLIIADTDSDMDVVQALAVATFEVGGEPTIAIMTPRDYHMQDPTPMIAEAMRRSTLNVLVTTKALIHSHAAGEAMKAGSRFLNLEEATMALLKMTKETVEDYEAVDALGAKLTAIWEEGSHWRLTTPSGTDLSGRCDGRPGYYVAGTSRPQPRITLRSCAFPDGEAGISPLEGTANGRLVFDLAILHTGIGKLKTPIDLEIKDGRIVAIRGDVEAESLRQYLEQKGDKGAYELCEVSIGLNPKIKLTGNKADKKVLGTMHVGFGNSKDIGGEVESKLHYDGVLSQPTLYIDGRLILENGKVVV